MAALPPQASAGAPTTRTELLQRRNEEMRHATQSSYDRWAHDKPMWAPRVSGAAAAEALGYTRHGPPATISGARTRQELFEMRSHENRRLALESAFKDSYGAKTDFGAPSSFHQSDYGMPTSITRPTTNPSLEWVEQPPHAHRTELLAARRKNDRERLEQQAENHVVANIPNANERVAMRVAQGVKLMREAQEMGGGKSRRELLAERRRHNAIEHEMCAASVGLEPQPRFSSQPEKWWHIGDAPKLNGGVGVGAVAHETNSHEELLTQQRWWAHPEGYRVNATPRVEQPFKLTQADADQRFLGRKLSSGPKKHQRGYPPGADEVVATKVTSVPAPELAVQEVLQKNLSALTFKDGTARMDSAAPKGAFTKMPRDAKRFTTMVTKFSDHPEGSGLHKLDPSCGGDELPFTLPLYSSFCKGGVFKPRKLPPRDARDLPPPRGTRRDEVLPARGAQRSYTAAGAAGVMSPGESWAARTGPSSSRLSVKPGQSAPSGLSGGSVVF